MQRFVLFLDYPAQSFAIVVCGLLASSGLGSFWSTQMPWRAALAALVGSVALYPLLLPTVFSSFLAQGIEARIGITLLLLAPLGFLMGIGFPRGLAALGIHPRLQSGRAHNRDDRVFLPRVAPASEGFPRYRPGRSARREWPLGNQNRYRFRAPRHRVVHSATRP